MRWTYLLSPAAPGPTNMALDEALMTRARDTGTCVLRVYAWSAPTLSLGRNQTARDAYDPRRLAEGGIDVVRRPTGGRAILHHREITYSVTAPETFGGDLRESYARINRLLADGLRRVGVDARIVGTGAREIAPGLAPCFARPSAGELVAGDRKLVGSAQWRTDGALLQHGSILVDDDQMQLASLLRQSSGAVVPPPPATLRALLGRAPAPREVGEALLAAVRALEDPDAAPLDAAEIARAGVLASSLEPRYRDDAWTWRR